MNAAQHGAMAEPGQASCWFNLGLAFNRIHLGAAADQAFERSAGLDHDRWADEARARIGQGRIEGRTDLLARIEPVIRGDPASATLPVPADADVVEELLQRQVLKQWAEAIKARDRSAIAGAARRARVLASPLQTATGDSFPVHLLPVP